MDYTIDYHAITFAINFTPIKRLDLTGSITYTYSKAGFDNVSFKNRLPELMAMNPTSPQAYAWGSFTKEWEEGHPTFDEMDDFSDLEMSTIEVGLSANYHITDKLMLNFNFNYDKFEDDEYYIYDGDGSITYIGFGIQYQL